MFSKALFLRVTGALDCLNNPLPDNKILDWSKLRQIPDDILKCIQSAFKVHSKQEGHDGPEIAHLSLLTKHAPSSFPVT